MLLGLVVVGVEPADREGRDAGAEAGAEQAGRVLEAAAEVAVGVLDRHGRKRVLVVHLQRHQLVLDPEGVGVGAPGGGEGGRAGVPGARVAVGLHEVAAPDALDAEVEVARVVDRRGRGRVGGEHGVGRPRDADPLERVVGRADHVEGASQPSGGLERRADDALAPVAGRVEVALVGVGEVDRRQHRHLALVVERLEAGEGGVPPELRRVGQGERRLGRDAEPAAQRGVQRVGERHQRVEPVVAAVEVQRDQDRRVRGGLGLRGGGLQHAAGGEAGQHARCRSTGPRRARAGCAASCRRSSRTSRVRRGRRRAPAPPRRRVRAGRGGWSASHRNRVIGGRSQRPPQQTCASGPASSRWRSTR